MGGIFSEGIDLKNDRLIGTVIVGTGLPMVCNERELLRGFFDRRNGQGFDYAYLYNGMNKVQQSAGRVIRTVEDEGVILLLDERFLNRQYQELFPREWFPYETVSLSTVEGKMKDFWARRGKDFCCREIAHDADGELPVVHFCLWGEAQPAALPGSIHRGDEQIFSAPGAHAVKNQLCVKRPVCESLFDGEDKVDQSAKPQAV